MVGRLCLGFGIGERHPACWLPSSGNQRSQRNCALSTINDVARLPKLKTAVKGCWSASCLCVRHLRQHCARAVEDTAVQSGSLPSHSASPAFPAGFVNQVAPLYLSEMAPYNYRGGLNVCFQASLLGRLGSPNPPAQACPALPDGPKKISQLPLLAVCA